MKPAGLNTDSLWPPEAQAILEAERLATVGRLRVLYRAGLRRYRVSPSIEIPFDVFKGLSEQSPSAAEFRRSLELEANRRRPKRLFPLAETTRRRLREDAKSVFHQERRALDFMREMSAIWDSDDRDEQFRRRTGSSALETAGMMMRYWFGPRHVGTPQFTVKFGAGPAIPSPTGNFELPIESKAWLFDHFVALLWSRLLKLRLPGNAPADRPLTEREERECRAFSILRDLLVRSYRKWYRGGRGHSEKLLQVPLSVWTKPPSQILPLLASTALTRAKKEMFMAQRAEPLWNNQGEARDDLLFEATGGERWEDGSSSSGWPEVFVSIPARLRSLAVATGPEAFLRAYEDVLSEATSEQLFYAETWSRSAALDVSPARLKVIRQSLVRKLERRLKRQA